MADTREEFIKKVYSQTYQMAQDNGLPHDFIMAQVIQETGWGKHILKDTNNIFNIKADKSWKGKKSIHHVWEVVNGKKVWVDADFRKYDSYGDSVKDWLKFLKNNKRYKALFEKENLSTDEFAKRIQEAGYATDPNYAKNIVNITKGKTYKRLIAKAKESYQNGDIQNKNSSDDTYIIKKGDYLGKIASRYNMSIDELLRINPQIIDKNSIKIGQNINISRQQKISKNRPQKEIKSEISSSNTWDKYTNKRIQKIHPLIRNNAINFINNVQKKLNIKLRVTTGMRTIEEQDNLYKKGRTTKGKKVTWVKGGYSYHNYGLAIDVVEIKDKRAKWNTKWQKIAKIGKDEGFEWGGDWKDVSDKPHFQKTFGYTTKQLKKMLSEGKVKNGFVDIKGGGTLSSNTETKKEIIRDKDNIYIVKKGDFLSKIAKKHNLSLKELLKLNPQITNKNKISIGQKIYISESLPKKKNKNTSSSININLENKSQKLFKKLGLRHGKIPTLNHNQNLPSKIEGVYKKDNLSLRKNPRVSDKKAEAVAMHEIYHHTQKDNGLELGQEEATANMIEKAYLNENQQTSQEVDFDLIYAYTIKQFYEHEELEQLVRVLGGDASCARRVYSNAMEVISEHQAKEVSNNIGYRNNQIKKVVGDSGVKYKQSDEKFKVSDKYSTIKSNLTRGLTDWVVTDSEANEVYTILDDLNEKDYVDTTTKMKNDDIWETYLENIEESKKYKVLGKGTGTKIKDVLKGKPWIAYGSSLPNGKHQCADYSREQVNQGDGNYTAVGGGIKNLLTKKSVDMTGGNAYTEDCEKALEIINRNLENDRAVMTGVDYAKTNTDNINSKTDHFVTIVGRGKDEKGDYFSYYDNYTGRDKKQHEENIGRDISKNKFRYKGLDDDGNCIYEDDDGTIPLTGNKADSKYTYRITEVRDNE